MFEPPLRGVRVSNCGGWC